MTISGTTLDIWHVFLWQWELAFLVTGFIPLIGWLLRIAMVWFVWDACVIVYRETTLNRGSAAAVLWAVACLIWPLTLTIWYRLYADTPLQMVEADDAGHIATTPVDRRTWKTPRLEQDPLGQRLDDDEFDHRPASYRAQHLHHPQESIRYPQPHPDRDPLANDGDPEVGELRDGEWEPVKPPKAKWARPQNNEAKFDPPSEPWKTLGA